MTQFANLIESIDSINVFTCKVLEGDYNITTYDQISKICENIPHINCRLCHKNFSVRIHKTDPRLKIKVSCIALSKDLIYFLHNMPNNVDTLKLNDFVGYIYASTILDLTP